MMNRLTHSFPSHITDIYHISNNTVSILAYPIKHKTLSHLVHDTFAIKTFQVCFLTEDFKNISARQQLYHNLLLVISMIYVCLLPKRYCALA